MDMKKKSYEAPEVMVVQLTQCAIIAASGNGTEDPFEETRERNPYEDQFSW